MYFAAIQHQSITKVGSWNLLDLPAHNAICTVAQKIWHDLFLCRSYLYQTDFQNWFTVRIRRKFVIIIIITKDPIPHLKRVATLPCEMSLSGANCRRSWSVASPASMRRPVAMWRHWTFDITSGSAMAEGPRDALVSKNSATTKYPYRMALFVWSYV